MKKARNVLWAMSTVLALGVAGAPFSTANAQAGATSCDDVEFSSDITSRFPRAQEACLGIVEKAGRQYAKFTARIERVSGGSVRAKMLLPDGSYSRETVTFEPASDARVNIQGRSYRYRDLSRGQEVNIYLPPDRWAIATHTDESTDFESAPAATVATVPLQTVEEPEATASLPSTASPLPLFGLLGGLFVAMAAGLTALRRRL